METTPPNNPPSENGGAESNYKTIDEQLKLAKIAINNALNLPELTILLSRRGYDKEDLEKALELHAKAEALHIAQKDKYGEKYGVTDSFGALWDEVNTEYTDHVALARIILKNERSELEKLQINGKRKQSISGWMGQAKAFYTNALGSASIKAALAKKGISEEELKANQAKIAQLEEAEADKFNKKGEAQKSTADRDDAIEDLLEWYRDFKDTAKVAFRREPKLLEKLGISLKE